MFSNNYVYANPRAENSLKINTSDHTFRTIEVQFIAQDGGTHTIRGATWNLMNKMCSNIKNRYNNNPWNYDEDFDQYLARKKQQLNEILDQAENGNLDYMSFQEVDIFSHNPYDEFFKDADFKNRLMALRVQFKEELAKLGWIMEVPPNLYSRNIPSYDRDQTPLVMIYNARTLAKDEDSAGSGFLRASLKRAEVKRGYRYIFRHIGSEQDIQLANWHLDFQDPYSQYADEINRAKAQCIENGYLFIGGGDFNRPSREDMNVFADKDIATNIRGVAKENYNPVKERQSHEQPNSTLAQKDANGRSIKKSYDYFIVDGPLGRINAVTLGGQEFLHYFSGKFRVASSIPKKYELKTKLLTDVLLWMAIGLGIGAVAIGFAALIIFSAGAAIPALGVSLGVGAAIITGTPLLFGLVRALVGPTSQSIEQEPIEPGTISPVSSTLIKDYLDSNPTEKPLFTVELEEPLVEDLTASDLSLSNLQVDPDDDLELKSETYFSPNSPGK